MTATKSFSIRCYLFLSVVILLLTSCTGHQPLTSIQQATPIDSDPETVNTDIDGPPPAHQRIDVADISDAVPIKEPLSRYGNPKSYEVFGTRYYPLSTSKGYQERGIASWYGSKFHGRRTSSGETYNMHAMTAAHKTLPLPTYVKVTNLNNQRQVILKVNDRGPFHPNRIIDLSHTAATKLGIINTGTALVEVEAIDPDLWNKQENKSDKAANKHQSQPVQLYIQIGAFLNKTNALKLQSSVHKKLQQATAISAGEKNGRIFYRVRLGPLSSTEQADQLAFHLTQQGFGPPRIVIE